VLRTQHLQLVQPLLQVLSLSTTMAVGNILQISVSLSERLETTIPRVKAVDILVVMENNLVEVIMRE
jgi:hypothetical protein